jgi:hypothetical protein
LALAHISNSQHDLPWPQGIDSQSCAMLERLHAGQQLLRLTGAHNYALAGPQGGRREGTRGGTRSRSRPTRPHKGLQHAGRPVGRCTKEASQETHEGGRASAGEGGDAARGGVAVGLRMLVTTTVGSRGARSARVDGAAQVLSEDTPGRVRANREWMSPPDGRCYCGAQNENESSRPTSNSRVEVGNSLTLNLSTEGAAL